MTVGYKIIKNAVIIGTYSIKSSFPCEFKQTETILRLAAKVALHQLIGVIIVYPFRITQHQKAFTLSTGN